MHRFSLIASSVALVAPLLAAPPASADTIAAKDLLAKFSVVGEKGSASYHRDKFSYPIDADGDGCGTRAEVLMQESRVKVTKADGCKVTKGK